MLVELNNNQRNFQQKFIGNLFQIGKKHFLIRILCLSGQFLAMILTKTWFKTSLHKRFSIRNPNNHTHNEPFHLPYVGGISSSLDQLQSSTWTHKFVPRNIPLLYCWWCPKNNQTKEDIIMVPSSRIIIREQRFRFGKGPFYVYNRQPNKITRIWLVEKDFEEYN